MKLKLDSKSLNNLASKIGSVVEICLKNKNTFITGKRKKILRSDKKFNLYLIITYPNIVCSTSVAILVTKNLYWFTIAITLKRSF